MQKITITTILTILFSVILINNAQATIYKTISSGNIDNESIWVPSKPNMRWGFNDTIYINHAVSSKKSINIFGHFIINSRGSLKSSKNIKIKDEAYFTNDGKLYTKNFIADWNHKTCINNSTIKLKASFENRNGTFINNGIITIKKTFNNNDNSIFINNNTINVKKNFTNKSKFYGTGNLRVDGNFLNEWNSDFQSSGKIIIKKKFTNRGSFTATGNITIKGSITNNSNSNITASGITIIKGKIINNGNIEFNNTAIIDGNITNSWSTKFISNDSLNVNGTIINKGDFNVSGNTIIYGDVDNQAIFNNYGNTEIVGDFHNSNAAKEINNHAGANLYISYSLENYNNIINNGRLLVDDYVRGNGDISGNGYLCHSDGETDPTIYYKGNISCNLCSSDPLPIELIKFDVTSIDDTQVSIKWTTATETNNDYFDVLRSEDAINFVSIKRIKGAGNSNSVLNYTFIDKNVENKTYYYAIKQTDFDSKNTMSDIVSVNINNNIEPNIYPNPVQTGGKINIDFSNNEFHKIDIYDISGKLIQSHTGHNMHEAINTDNLKQGIYIITIQNNNNISTEKLIINK